MSQGLRKASRKMNKNYFYPLALFSPSSGLGAELCNSQFYVHPSDWDCDNKVQGKENRENDRVFLLTGWIDFDLRKNG